MGDKLFNDPQTFNIVLGTTFGALALVLAAIGICGAWKWLNKMPDGDYY